MRRIGERAVVIGASMAGLLAARALADFYGTVTVLDRAVFPVADIPRKGVPQGRHAHGSCRVAVALIEQFSGLTDEVVAAGGVWATSPRTSTGLATASPQECAE